MKKTAVIALSLFLSGCYYGLGEPVCLEKCQMNLDQSKYILENNCGLKPFSMPTNVVAKCLQCSDVNSLKYDGNLYSELSFPDFKLIKNPIQYDKDNNISINISDASCLNTTGTTKTRSQEIKEFLDTTLANKVAFDKFSKPKYLDNNFYVAKNHAQYGVNEKIYFYLDSNNEYEFMILCKNNSCFSPSNKIKDAPYIYHYGFKEPIHSKDIIKIDKAVKNFVHKTYKED